jgi:hypothetical protein
MPLTMLALLPACALPATPAKLVLPAAFALLPVFPLTPLAGAPLAFMVGAPLPATPAIALPPAVAIPPAPAFALPPGCMSGLWKMTAKNLETLVK